MRPRHSDGTNPILRRLCPLLWRSTVLLVLQCESRREPARQCSSSQESLATKSHEPEAHCAVAHIDLHRVTRILHDPVARWLRSVRHRDRCPAAAERLPVVGKQVPDGFPRPIEGSSKSRYCRPCCEHSSRGHDRALADHQTARSGGNVTAVIPPVAPWSPVQTNSRRRRHVTMTRSGMTSPIDRSTGRRYSLRRTRSVLFEIRPRTDETGSGPRFVLDEFPIEPKEDIVAWQ